ncbi:hypothetical protein [Frigoriflavimonas asaccharolytica]|uniref:Uncharacterized protein n=1 Tax=Frigoriflavimonas asaccharolytica TaxID=2735899 RepID=A0A8J8GA49_9FLAO|nr:hypothetical protein [Frigoriflavimonas asaccharolytica]NRS91807.1 hypothetical protein [Frigoriflavimonas asaccharolytica]
MKKIIFFILILGFQLIFAQNEGKVDTISVSQADPLVFEKITLLAHRPCQKPRLETNYYLKNPKNGAYYIIYNEEKQLTLEGTYVFNETNKGLGKDAGSFYDSKSYHYKKNGNIDFIHYQKEGRNSRTEYFDGKKRLKKIRYIDKKSGDTDKIEIYQKGKLKETRIYTAFSTYHTVKSN